MRQYWLQRYNASVPCYLQSSHTNLPSRSKLTLAKMSSAFIGLGVGLFFGILVWITEIVVWVLKVRINRNVSHFIPQKEKIVSKLFASISNY